MGGHLSGSDGLASVRTATRHHYRRCHPTVMCPSGTRIRRRRASAAQGRPHLSSFFCRPGGAARGSGTAALLSGPAAFRGAALDAELIALGIGHDNPAGPVGPAQVVDKARADAEQSRDLFVTAAGGGHEVKVHPVLDYLAVGDGDEQQTDPVSADDPAFGVTAVVRVAWIFLPAGDLAPEQRLAVRIGTVDRDTADIEHTGFLTCGCAHADGGASGRDTGRGRAASDY